MTKCWTVLVSDIHRNVLLAHIISTAVSAGCEICLQMLHVAWSVCLSVCLWVDYTNTGKPCKNGWTAWDAVWGVDSCGSKEPHISWRCTFVPTEPTMLCRSAGCRSHYLLVLRLLLRCERLADRWHNRRFYVVASERQAAGWHGAGEQQRVSGYQRDRDCFWLDQVGRPLSR